MRINSALSRATGAGVRVALIDSGVNAQHSHVGFVAGGLGFAVDTDGVAHERPDCTDRIGHGTALAGILRAKAPQVELYAVKIFSERLATSFVVLEAALRWAINQRMHVINLSLGTDNVDHRDRMIEIVAQANAAGSLLVASAPPGRTDVLPAALSSVIGVAGDERCTWEEYFYVEDPIPFRAHPCPRSLPSLPQERNFRGHSFASAHISALVARLVEQCPGFTVDAARKYLMTNAKRKTQDVA